MTHAKPAPALSRSMILLGYAGLIPFVGLSLIVCLGLFDMHTEATRILNIYSFGIIVFLCGSSWPNIEDVHASGKSLISNALFLLAFFSFILIPEHWALLAALYLWLIYLIEHKTYLLGSFKPAYKSLRKQLTCIASLSMLAVYLFN